MSIKNEPKIRNPLIAAIREQPEHRALWIYLLCDEAKKRASVVNWIFQRPLLKVMRYVGSTLSDVTNENEPRQKI